MPDFLSVVTEALVEDAGFPVDGFWDADAPAEGFWLLTGDGERAARMAADLRSSFQNEAGSWVLESKF